MADGLKVEVNDREVKAALKQLGYDIDHMRTAHLRAGQAVAKVARSRARVKTGRMRDAILVRANADGVTIENHIPYAVYQDKGTRYIKGNQFMSGALDIAQAEVEAIYRRAVDDAVRRAGGGA